MKLVLATDPFAQELKDHLAQYLSHRGIELVMIPEEKNLPYYETAVIAAQMIQRGEAEGGILLCGTGAGMNIVANKFAGITAVCVESVFAASRAKAINRANVLTMGAMIVGKEMACAMADAWIDTKPNEGLEGIADFLNQAAEDVRRIDEKLRK